MSECRYWPEIHELLPNDQVGALRVVSPGKVDATLKKRKDWAWYQQEIDLWSEHLVGPFDFSKINREGHRVGVEEWFRLRNVAHGKNIDVDSLDRCVPLESYY